MRVTIKVFATLARWFPTAQPGQPMDMVIVEPSTIQELIDHLKLPRAEVKVVFVNGRSRPPDWQLHDGDEIGIFPAIGGG